MPDIKNLLFRFYLKHWFPPVHSAVRSLPEQQKNFAKLLSLSDTALGKDLKLSAVKTYEDYKSAVPVTSYSFYEPYVERIKEAEQNVMTTGKVIWFGKTAGTTSGKSKLIPVTSSYIKHGHVCGTFFGLSRLHHYDKTVDMISHKNFLMTGGVYETLSPSGIRVADVSAINLNNVPLPFRGIYAPNIELSTHPSWEYKLDRIAEVVSRADVGSLSGIPTWHLAVLNKIREYKKFRKLNELWPNLRIFFHGGVNFEPYRNHFRELSGRNDFVFYEFYNATEGVFGVQAEPEGGDLLLLTDTGVFYEFVPFAEFHTGNAKAVSLAEVKTGVPYVLLISTFDGLLRYVIGDVITFSSIDPYKFRIVGRTQEYINAFGEDLLLGHVERAMAVVSEKFNCLVAEFTVAPFYIEIGAKGKMQFLLEFIIAPADLNAYAAELDAQLQKENSNYAQKRNNSIALSSLEIIVAKPGTFYKWLQSKGKLGGQNKVPRLVNSRKIIEEILAVR